MGKDKRKHEETEEKKSKKVKQEEEKKEETKPTEETDKFLVENQINLKGDNIPKYIQKFEDLKDTISSKILKKLKKKNFVEPTLIQKIALPCALDNRDCKL